MPDSQTDSQTDSPPTFGGDSEAAYRQGRADAWTSIPAGGISRLGLDDSTIVVDENGDTLAIFDDLDCLAAYFLGRGTEQEDFLDDEPPEGREATQLARHLIGINALTAAPFGDTETAKSLKGVVVATIPVSDLATARAACEEFARRHLEASGQAATLAIDTITEARRFGRANFGRALAARTDPDDPRRTLIYATGNSEKILASAFGEELASIALRAAHPEGAG